MSLDPPCKNGFPRSAFAMADEKSTLDELRIDRSVSSKGGRGSAVAWVLVFGALLALAYWWYSNRPRTVEVRSLTVRENSGGGGGGGARTLLNASGYVVARREATVSSKVTGKVIEVLIEEGMKVKEGQVLARLDTSNVVANLRLVEAQLDVAKSTLIETKVRLRETELELRRVSDLARSKIASQADLDHAEAEFNSAKARLERQQAEVTVAERQVGLWNQQMEDAVIRAPYSGVVTAKNAQPGEMISPISAGGGFTRTGICTIVDMDSQEIEVDVNESYINRVEPDQSVQATLDAYGDWKIPCRVIAIVPTADRQKATVRVRVAFEKLDRRILPHMGVKVAFQGADAKTNTLVNGGVTIPKTALRQEGGKDVVFVLNADRAARRAVTLGETRLSEVVVLTGLVAGETIVLDVPATLSDGSKIREAKR